jgi:hypothetical protein
MNTFTTARPSYNYCGICGHTPDSNDEPNRAPLRWWDPDDGYKVGTLCRSCAEEFLHCKPKPSDFAYRRSNQVCDAEDTDEDVMDAIE